MRLIQGQGHPGNDQGKMNRARVDGVWLRHPRALGPLRSCPVSHTTAWPLHPLLKGFLKAGRSAGQRCLSNQQAQLCGAGRAGRSAPHFSQSKDHLIPTPLDLSHGDLRSREGRECTLDLVPLYQLQRFKRSLSLKTILRSKSVENFLFRSGSELKCPTEVLLTPPTPLPPPTPPPASADRGLPTPAPSPCPVPRPLAPLKPVRLHSFQEHVFKRASPCELCHQLIVGNSKQGLRCKTCKVSVHLWCSEEISHQQCPGKTSSSFRRNFSSPLLVHEPPPACAMSKESPPTGASGKVDPVYETLRYGTSLALMNRSSFSSTSESPTRSLSERDELTEDGEGSIRSSEEGPGDSVFTAPAESEGSGPEEKSPGQQPPRPALRKDVGPMYSYVALYKFLPQEKNDLALQPGDRIMLVDDSNEDWWKGKIGDRVGFFPANFVQRVRPGENVWRCCQPFSGNKEQGYMSLKENQICVGVGRSKDADGFIRVSSGKKRGLVPADALTEI